MGSRRKTRRCALYLSNGQRQSPVISGQLLLCLSARWLSARWWRDANERPPQSVLEVAGSSTPILISEFRGSNSSSIALGVPFCSVPRSSVLRRSLCKCKACVDVRRRNDGISTATTAAGQFLTACLECLHFSSWGGRRWKWRTRVSYKVPIGGGRTNKQLIYLNGCFDCPRAARDIITSSSAQASNVLGARGR